MDVRVPVSLGELLDKISILEIKNDRIADPAKRANVQRELEALTSTYNSIDELGAAERAALCAPISDLKAVNLTLWTIEDEIRLLERSGDFSEAFIALARAVDRNNDERARIKKDINIKFGSTLVEEKSYA